MANNYSQFSAMITDVTDAEAKWISWLLNLDADVTNERAQLMSELVLEGDIELNAWPYFEWSLTAEKDALWLYSEEGFSEDHLTFFIQGFINKFRPDYIFSVTGSDTCSKPRIGEFGGWWLVISKDHFFGGNTWDDARAAVSALKTGNFGPEID